MSVHTEMRDDPRRGTSWRSQPHSNEYWTRDLVVERIQAWAREHDGTPPSATDWNPSQAISLGHPERAEKFHRDGTWPYLSTVRARFGKWNAAIAAAGFAPVVRNQPARDDPDAIPRRIRLREAGLSMIAIAECEGVTVGAIYKIFQRHS